MGEKDTCCFTGHRPSKLPWGTREEDPRCVALKGRIAAALEEEAVSSLAQAKAMHDDLEAVYNPHVDFDRVHQRGEEIVEAFLALEERK